MLFSSTIWTIQRSEHISHPGVSVQTCMPRPLQCDHIVPVWSAGSSDTFVIASDLCSTVFEDEEMLNCEFREMQLCCRSELLPWCKHGNMSQYRKSIKVFLLRRKGFIQDWADTVKEYLRQSSLRLKVTWLSLPSSLSSLKEQKMWRTLVLRWSAIALVLLMCRWIHQEELIWKQQCFWQSCRLMSDKLCPLLSYWSSMSAKWRQ